MFKKNFLSFLLLSFILLLPKAGHTDEAESVSSNQATSDSEDFTSDKLIEKANQSLKEKIDQDIKQTQSKEEDSSPAFDDPNRLTAFSCEKLILKSQDKTFSLKALAGIRATKRCKGFKYDLKTLTALEKRLFTEEIDELDATKPPSTQSLSIAELRKKLAGSKSNAEKFSNYKALRLKQKTAGQRNDYLKTTAELFNWAKAEFKKKITPESQSHYNEATLILSRTYWTEGRTEQAEKILNDSIRQLKERISIADLYFILGRMHEEKEDFPQAVKAFDLAEQDYKLHKPKNAAFSLDRLMWLKAWILYKTSKWQDSEKAFAELAATTTDLSEKSRALFYRARSLQQLDQKAEAKAVLEKIVQDDFFGFYGLVAYHELGQKLPALSKIKFEKKFPFDTSLSFLTLEEKSIFLDLIKYQEIDLAERSIIYLAKTPEKQVNLSIVLAENANRFLPLFAAFSKLNNDFKIELLLTHGELIYPKPYETKVKEMSEKTELPSSLIYAIMKQESAFNPNIRSSANALGLMQVIPRLAKHLAKKFKLNYEKPSDLYNPEIAIPLGSYELMEQVKKQEGQLTYVAAAYNAGPNALAGWLKKKNKRDILEFIEEIPYEETRTYVKLIARNKLFYERFSDRDKEVSFPKDFLSKKAL